MKVHDFVIPTQRKVIPYGVYDLSRNEGWVSVGIDPDTAGFAVNAIRSWWKRMGRPAYPRPHACVSRPMSAGHELARPAVGQSAAVVNLTGRTTTTAGLRVRSEIDKRAYPKGVLVADHQMERLHLSPHAFHGDWNYTIQPHNESRSESSVS